MLTQADPALLIVFHSRTGGARQMAQAAANAARGEVSVLLREAREAGPAELLGASGYLFAMPENLAGLSGVMKDFFDRSYYPVLDQIGGRPYGAMVCAGSDGQGAARQVERICTGWRLKAVAPTLIVCTHAQTPAQILADKLIGKADLVRCGVLGSTLAAGLALGMY